MSYGLASLDLDCLKYRKFSRFTILGLVTFVFVDELLDNERKE